jgi:hypothetical protein
MAGDARAGLLVESKATNSQVDNLCQAAVFSDLWLDGQAGTNRQQITSVASRWLICTPSFIRYPLLLAFLSAHSLLVFCGLFRDPIFPTT